MYIQLQKKNSWFVIKHKICYGYINRSPKRKLSQALNWILFHATVCDLKFSQAL